MATTLELLPQGTAVSLLTTELNALATGDAALGGAVNNVNATANLAGYPFGRVELVLAAPASAFLGTPAFLWFLRQTDGTNYEDGGSAVVPQREPDVLFFPRATASAQRLAGVNGTGADRGSTRVRLPVGNLKPLFYWPSRGIALAASGNTVKVLAETDKQI